MAALGTLADTPSSTEFMPITIKEKVLLL